jgi:hypothetical protein
LVLTAFDATDSIMSTDGMMTGFRFGRDET